MAEELEDDRAKYLHGQPKDLTVDQKFRLILRLLREQFAPDLPVRVRRHSNALLKKKSGYKDAPYGWCSKVNSEKTKNKQYYYIEINKGVPWRQQFETILHEWAHALTWGQAEQGKDHSDIFHRVYGKLYRAFVED